MQEMTSIMDTEAIRQPILAPSTRLALEQLDKELQRGFDMSLVLTTADGGPAYSDPDSGSVPDLDVLRRLNAEVAGKEENAIVSLDDGRTACVAPVNGDSEVVGALVAYSHNGITAPTDRAQASSVFAVLSPFAILLGDNISKDVAIDSLTDEIALRYEELTYVYELAGNMEIDQRLSLSLDKIFGTALTSLELDGLVLFTEQTGQSQVYVPPDGETELTADDLSCLARLEHQARSAVSESGNPWIANELHKDARFPDATQGCSHLIAVPVNVQDDDQGVITVVRSSAEHRFYIGDVKLISALAKQVAIVIRNARLFGEVRSLFLNLVKSLIAIVEAKHKHTRGHSERVHAISGFLADQLGLVGKTREALHWASLFHDIGKISIPDAILNKPGKLTDEEFDTIKRHPAEGYEVLSHIEQLHDALPGIRHHHEKMDGTGYPDRIEGDEIPLIARVIAVADVYDALTSTRSYRPKMSEDKALGIMRDGEGNHFDPRVLKVFLDKHDEMVQLIDKPAAEPSEEG